MLCYLVAICEAELECSLSFALTLLELPRRDLALLLLFPSTNKAEVYGLFDSLLFNEFLLGTNYTTWSHDSNEAHGLSRSKLVLLHQICSN